jgi:hypothetical protein
VSTAAPTIGALASRAVPATTTASDAARATSMRGSELQRSPPSSGPRTTATTIWITRIPGKTLIAERSCSAVISLISPRRAAVTVAASHISVISQAPPKTASPMNFVESADQA